MNFRTMATLLDHRLPRGTRFTFRVIRTTEPHKLAVTAGHMDNNHVTHWSEQSEPIPDSGKDGPIDFNIVVGEMVLSCAREILESVERMPADPD